MSLSRSMYRHSLGAVGDAHPDTAEMSREEAIEYMEELKLDCERIRDRIEFNKTAMNTKDASISIVQQVESTPDPFVPSWDRTSGLTNPWLTTGPKNGDNGSCALL